MSRVMQRLCGFAITGGVESVRVVPGWVSQTKDCALPAGGRLNSSCVYLRQRVRLERKIGVDVRGVGV